MLEAAAATADPAEVYAVTHKAAHNREGALMQEVAVLGVGMTPFVARSEASLREQTYRAGRAALDDARIKFPQVGSVYMGYLWEPTMTGVRS